MYENRGSYMNNINVMKNVQGNVYKEWFNLMNGGK